MQTASKELAPFKNDQEYLEMLQGVLEEDYNLTLVGEPLKEAGNHISEYLTAILL